MAICFCTNSYNTSLFISSPVLQRTVLMTERNFPSILSHLIPFDPHSHPQSTFSSDCGQSPEKGDGVTRTFRERVPAPGTCISGGSTRTDLPARVPALVADLSAEPWFAPGERLPTIARLANGSSYIPLPSGAERNARGAASEPIGTDHLPIAL